MLPRVYRPEVDIRKHQITTLKIFNDNVTEVTEGIEYQVRFNSGGNELCLQITLSKEFPKEKPNLKITPTIVHPWVNSEGEITSAPGLLNFTVHSDLGRVVQAIIREFQRTPPPLLTDHTLNNVVSPTVPIRNDEHKTSANYSNFPNSFSPPSGNVQSTIFPELNKLTINELRFLTENDDRQQEFLDELPYIKEQNKALDEKIRQVEELAESNMSKQEQMENFRKGIEARVEEVTKLAFENERLHVKYQNLSDKYSPRNIQEQLRLAAESADKASEKIADSFLNGGIDVDRFVTQFLRTRTVCQMRKTKEEKLSHQLDRLERAGF